VSETPIPNNHVIEEARCGLVAPYGDDAILAEMIEAATFKNWDREHAVQYILTRHAWDHRRRVFERLVAAAFRGTCASKPRLTSVLALSARHASEELFVARGHDVERVTLDVSPRGVADAGTQNRVVHSVKRLGSEVVDVSHTE